MNILLDIAVGVAAGLAVFVLASVLLPHIVTRLLEVNDARDRDLINASIHRLHKEHSK